MIQGNIPFFAASHGHFHAYMHNSARLDIAALLPLISLHKLDTFWIAQSE
jgi:hypothetical protein